MKFAAVLCVFLALFGLSVAVKDEICGLPPAVDGNGLIKCAAFVPSWSYFPEDNSCKKFTFGGCGGNANRFGTQQECESKCKE
ncbi:male accessory gland serine protease inhibitor-like [Drosophila hydei]|uniref:Male accessory gland serine protease inhibitor-like n=1 Tax=Drosophila hydei TaxID=7224 RepID=A0A6J1M5A3_DROHY|nr:male accessory gland serine protease inhibitor-like [Drosophila hydei]